MVLVKLIVILESLPLGISCIHIYNVTSYHLYNTSITFCRHEYIKHHAPCYDSVKPGIALANSVSASACWLYIYIQNDITGSKHSLKYQCTSWRDSTHIQYCGTTLTLIPWRHVWVEQRHNYCNCYFQTSNLVVVQLFCETNDVGLCESSSNPFLNQTGTKQYVLFGTGHCCLD